MALYYLHYLLCIISMSANEWSSASIGRHVSMLRTRILCRHRVKMVFLFVWTPSKTRNTGENVLLMDVQQCDQSNVSRKRKHFRLTCSNNPAFVPRPAAFHSPLFCRVTSYIHWFTKKKKKTKERKKKHWFSGCPCHPLIPCEKARQSCCSDQSGSKSYSAFPPSPPVTLL